MTTRIETSPLILPPFVRLAAIVAVTVVVPFPTLANRVFMSFCVKQTRSSDWPLWFMSPPEIVLQRAGTVTPLYESVIEWYEHVSGVEIVGDRFQPDVRAEDLREGRS